MRELWRSSCVLFALCCGVACQSDAELEKALAGAGENRAELEKALAQAPAGQQAAVRFLIGNMPEKDARTLSAEFLLRETAAAHAARAAAPWGEALPAELFEGYVLPYAQADEKREDWRTGFAKRFGPLVADCKTPGEAARTLNEQIFDLVNVHYSTKRRSALQSPSESIEQSKATCTGLSILLADACRACAVPARLVSVNWPHKRGNHTWVEVWDGEQWRFCGADEPDPKGLDRGWFVGAAKKCAGADRAHRIWAVSFAKTGERMRSGWSRGVELWGVDVTARYAPEEARAAVPDSGDLPLSEEIDRIFNSERIQEQDEALAAQLDRYFAADAERRAKFEFDRNLDDKLKTVEGDAALRAAVFAAFKRAELPKLKEDHEARRVRAGDKESPFTVKQVGSKPAMGWPLVIAMHGGGGAPKRVNDSQWKHMQIYYKDHPEAGGYLYCALRAPTDEWNGFYTDYFYPLLEKLIRQFVVCDDVNPDRVIALGYSHGGYGAFAIGPKLPHRFAAVHSSAAAPTDGQSLPDGLHTLKFSFMVGGKDTAYGRRKRCEKFDAALAKLKAERPGLYPTTFSLIAGNGHGGLPDRDLLPRLLPHVRQATPKVMYWRPSDKTVRDHYWLRIVEPKKGQSLEARIEGGSLSVTAEAVGACEAWLDARVVAMGEPLALDVNGEARVVRPAPSLRTLCATMADRGDPSLAASWVVKLLP